MRLERAILLTGLLLCLSGWSQRAVDEALAQAAQLLKRAQVTQGIERQRLIEQARRTLSLLPAGAREPLEQQLNQARWSNRPGALQTALRQVESYRRTLVSSSPAPDPTKVRRQLEAIFAEPDMQPPPKPLVERIVEAIGRAFETLLRWLTRLLGGLGGTGTGAWGALVQWIIIAILVLAIAFGASYLVGRLEWRRGRCVSAALTPDQMVDARLLSSAEWLALAHQLLAHGDTRAAVRALYLGLLRLLHEARLLDYDPARTNWEHLMSLRSPALSDPATREQAYRLLQPLTLRFDYLWYGNETATTEDVQRFEQAFETLRGMVRPDAQRVA